MCISEDVNFMFVLEDLAVRGQCTFYEYQPQQPRFHERWVNYKIVSANTKITSMLRTINQEKIKKLILLSFVMKFGVCEPSVFSPMHLQL